MLRLSAARLSLSSPMARAANWAGAGRQQRQFRPAPVVASAARRDLRADRYGAAARKPSAAPGAETSQPTLQPKGSALPEEPLIVSSRKWLMGLAPPQSYRVTGVSFEGRQALIPLLSRGQALAFVREPDNEFDPNAVSVRTLNDQSLGYISRSETAHFSQNLCFGQVESAGPAAGGERLWGMAGTVQPTIPPVEVIAFPAKLATHVCKGLQLDSGSSKAWAALCCATMAAAQGRCAVTASPEAEVHEQWGFDDKSCVLHLLGFRAEAPQLRQLGGLLELKGRAIPSAKDLLQQLNCWSAGDLETYLEHKKQLRKQRSSQDWRLDLSLLEKHGIAVPDDLKSLCV